LVLTCSALGGCWCTVFDFQRRRIHRSVELADVLTGLLSRLGHGANQVARTWPRCSIDTPFWVAMTIRSTS